MGRIILGISLLIGLTAPAFGQVEMPTTVKAKPGKLTQIVIKNAAPKMAWTFVEAEGIEYFREHDPDAKVLKLRFVAEPGTYYLIVATANGDIKTQVCVITVEGARPPPDPKPEPKNDPVKHLSFVGGDAATAGVVNSAELRTFLSSVGVKVHLIPAGEIPEGMRSHVAAAGGIPCIVLQDGAGYVIASERITTVEAAKNLVKKYLGK